MEVETHARRASTLVVFGIPAMVLAGATWHFTHSWGAVGLAVVVLYGVGGFISSRLRA